MWGILEIFVPSLVFLRLLPSLSRLSFQLLLKGVQPQFGEKSTGSAENVILMPFFFEDFMNTRSEKNSWFFCTIRYSNQTIPATVAETGLLLLANIHGPLPILWPIFELAGCSERRRYKLWSFDKFYGSLSTDFKKSLSSWWESWLWINISMMTASTWESSGNFLWWSNECDSRLQLKEQKVDNTITAQNQKKGAQAAEKENVYYYFPPFCSNTIQYVLVFWWILQ